MAVLIDNRQNKHRISHDRIRQTAKVILDDLGCTDAELSILIVDDPQIAELNETYLRHTGPTNVISFPLQEGQFSEYSSGLLGDVVISIETAAKEGDIAGISVAARFEELLVHGILHLVGYDHVNDAAKAQEMEAKTRHVLDRIAALRDG